MTPARQAEALRALHRPGDPLVLPNAWDAASARRLAAAGADAIATTSAAVARSLGYDDGEATPVDEMFAAVARIAAAVDVPVTADLEAGYGLDAEQLVERLLEAGAVGLNLEDSRHDGAGLRDAAAQAERLAAVKAAGRAAGVDVVLNARVDSFVHGGMAAVDDAVARSRRYAAAGADCVYPIGARGRAPIRRLVREAGAPVNVHWLLGGLGRRELAELGVARVSFGAALAELALDAAVAHFTSFS